MGIRFILMANKQVQTRLAQFYENLSIPERCALVGEIVGKCLARTEKQTVNIEVNMTMGLLSSAAKLHYSSCSESKTNEVILRGSMTDKERDVNYHRWPF